MEKIRFQTASANYLIERSIRSSSDPVNFYIHGGPGLNAVGERILLSQAISARLNFLSSDLIGCGQSPVNDPTRVTWKNQMDDLVEMIRIHGNGPVQVIAHSFASHVCHSLVQSNPELIKKVVFVSPSFDMPKRFKRTALLLKSSGRLHLEAEEQKVFSEFVDTPNETFGLNELLSFATIFMKADDPFSLYWKNLHAMNAYRQATVAHPLNVDTFMRLQLESFGLPAPRRQLYEGIPVQIIHGKADPITTLEDDAFPLAEILGVGNVRVIPDAAHWPHFENTDEWLREMVPFLTG